VTSSPSRIHVFASRLVRGKAFLALIRGRGVLLATALLLCALHAGQGQAQDRLVRTFAQDHGLTAPPVWALAQDSTGFLWIGAEGGLFRFDGVEIRRWAREKVRHAVDCITVSPDGRVVIRERGGSLFEVVPEGVRRLPLPGVSPRNPWETISFDRDGQLWIVQGGDLAYLDRQAEWRVLPGTYFEGERPRRVKMHPGDGVVVATDAGVWWVVPGTAPRRLATARVVDMVWADPERLLLLAGLPDRVVEITPGVQRELTPSGTFPPARPISIVERNGTVWVALDRFLVALRPGERPELIGQDRGVESGGPLLLDREGSLWLGSFGGLHQYPEPDTRYWGDRDGLPSRHTRFLERTGDALWVGTWAGYGYLHRSESGWTVHSLPWDTQSFLCADARGTVWTGVGGSLLAIRDTVVTRVSGQPMASHRSCAQAPGGALWIGTPDDLRYFQPDGPDLRIVPSPPGSRPGEERFAWLHDSRDRLWIGIGDRICHAPASRLHVGAADAWRCQRVPGLGYLGRVVELPGGTLWAATFGLGILAYREERWQPLAMDDLPTRTVFALVPSPRGGIWMVGHGILQRVRERGDDGWEVLERLTGWHGVYTSGGSDLLEETDGTIWIATSRGVAHLPPEVRFSLRPTPPATLVEARVDDGPVALGELLRLPHHRNRVELRFAALSFREPSRLRHQVRLGLAESWVESNGRPSFRWVELRPGHHQIEYRASLDGLNWTAEPIRFAFEVLPAWYRAPWFLGLVALLVGAIAWSLYRARVAYLIGLERQRTRIALDLHDEVGSGLASVGILSGVIAADGLAEPERREVAGEIASAAEELGHALSDIVWSLDPRAATLEELATRLAEHGARLCADGEPEFAARFPHQWPAGPLDVAVRRNVLLVGLEALHNAVRHAGASKLLLSLLPAAAGGWELSVRDDGIGFAGDVGHDDRRANGRRGHGLPGMERRAEEIGAALTVRSERSRGTTVTLRFEPRPRLTSRYRMFGPRLRRVLPRRLT
jgi:signal transduction histidine kinase/ligand-binding sensor domain-containing protein